MAKKDLFDSIAVPEPCPQSWDAMVGDNKARFCASCEKDIYNLSEMTRGEAKKLIFQSKESVCVRLEKDTHGKVKTLKRQLHQITRQVPIAAGVLSASLAFAAVADAQRKPPPRPRPPVGKLVFNKDILDAKSTASISGTITDVQGAVIPNVQIVLLDAKNKKVQTTQSNNDGFYEFKNIKAGVYSLEAEMRIFKKFVKNNLKLKADEEIEISFSLKIENESEVVGVLVFEEPLEIKESKVSDKIQPQQTESLPAVNRKPKKFMGIAISPKSNSKKQTVTKKSKRKN